MILSPPMKGTKFSVFFFVLFSCTQDVKLMCQKESYVLFASLVWQILRKTRGGSKQPQVRCRQQVSCVMHVEFKDIDSTG